LFLHVALNNINLTLTIIISVAPFLTMAI